MDHLDDIDALKIRALCGVWKPDYEATIRRIFRWYSERFHTPLHMVQELCFEEVILHYFEGHYESLSPQERHDLAVTLLETPAEYRSRKAAEVDSEAQFIKETEELAKLGTSHNKSLKRRMAEIKPAPKAPSKLMERQEEDEISISYEDKDFDLDVDPFAPPKKK
jgi:hypothetical protein